MTNHAPDYAALLIMALKAAVIGFVMPEFVEVCALIIVIVFAVACRLAIIDHNPDQE